MHLSLLCKAYTNASSSFERHQYRDIRKLWENAEDNQEYKSVCDVYGAEHLARLIGLSTIPPSLSP